MREKQDELGLRRAEQIFDSTYHILQQVLSPGLQETIWVRTRQQRHQNIHWHLTTLQVLLALEKWYLPA